MPCIPSHKHYEGQNKRSKKNSEHFCFIATFVHNTWLYDSNKVHESHFRNSERAENHNNNQSILTSTVGIDGGI